MKYINVKAFAAIAIILTVGVWLVLLFLSGVKLQATWSAFKQLPTVLSIEMILWALFVKWGWRFRVFKPWLVPFPFIQGTWRGTLTTTWINPETNRTPDPIEVILVVRQTFLSVHCAILTKESNSRSYTASIHIDPESGENRLVYSYTNTPRVIVRDRSPVHDGTTSLLVVGDPPTGLTGEYWTNRKTTGEMELSYLSPDLAEQFPEDA